MNFFEHQDQARKNTRNLLMLLILAIISLIVITSIAISLLLFFGQTSLSTNAATTTQFISFLNQQFHQGLFGYIAVGVCLFVAFGTGYKLLQLKQGGRIIAENLGGRLLNTDTRNAHERQLLNVVEEMSIAAGTPVPPVYLLQEDGINAFAAGFHPKDAVIGITQGAVELLSRDELQGVIAHEFSHILHGDMRLNIRLLGILHGILLIGLLGHQILRGSHRSTNRRGGGGIVLLGLALVILGYGGTFFGNIIKAALSRQREFLADASAVQFTRNPDGISGALQKIGGYSKGSTLHASNAVEFSHMYFSQGVSTALHTLMATHPPLAQRIKRITPQWAGHFDNVTHSATAPTSDTIANTTTRFTSSAAPTNTLMPTAIDSIGQPIAEHLISAKEQIATIPAQLISAAHEPFSARSLIYCLLLSKQKSRHWKTLKACAHPVEFAQTQQLIDHITGLEDRLHLPLIDIAIPALKQQSASQYRVFKKAMIALIKMDGELSLYEWSIYRLIVHCLEPQSQTGNVSIKDTQQECALILSLVAHSGYKNSLHSPSKKVLTREQAFNRGARQLPFTSLPLTAHTAISLKEIDRAILRLNTLKPLEKPTLLKALALCVEHDNHITPQEAEVLRAIAESLDSPVPPLLSGQEWI